MTERQETVANEPPPPWPLPPPIPFDPENPTAVVTAEEALAALEETA